VPPRPTISGRNFWDEGWRFVIVSQASAVATGDTAKVWHKARERRINLWLVGDLLAEFKRWVEAVNTWGGQLEGRLGRTGMLKRITVLRERADDASYPFSIAAIHELQELSVRSRICFVPGENGTGKMLLRWTPVWRCAFLLAFLTGFGQVAPAQESDKRAQSGWQLFDTVSQCRFRFVPRFEGSSLR
jgi:hypothetical protein